MKNYVCADFIIPKIHLLTNDISSQPHSLHYPQLKSLMVSWVTVQEHKHGVRSDQVIVRSVEKNLTTIFFSLSFSCLAHLCFSQLRQTQFEISMHFIYKFHNIFSCKPSWTIYLLWRAEFYQTFYANRALFFVNKNPLLYQKSL